MDKCRVNSTQIITSLITVASIAVLGLWFNAAQAQRLSGYVDKPIWNQRNAVVDDRFDKLEKYVQDGRLERMVFQREVLERLVRIEERLTAHTNDKKP